MKGSKGILLLLGILLHFSLVGNAQLPHWQPTLGYTPDLSPEAHQAFSRYGMLISSSELNPAEEQELTQLYNKWGFSEDIERLGLIEGVACSWYCGGGPYEVRASSTLAPQGNNSYEAKNAHDLDFLGVWAEGKAGDGLGEWLEYRFAFDSPRLTEIKIYNGYVKTEKAWQENSRVKSLKLYMNGKAIALLQLQDTRAEQKFTLPTPWGHLHNQQDMVLRFEIVEVYKGSKYSDTVLTEIFFDGIDVH